MATCDGTTRRPVDAVVESGSGAASADADEDGGGGGEGDGWTVDEWG